MKIKAIDIFGTAALAALAGVAIAGAVKRKREQDKMKSIISGIGGRLSHYIDQATYVNKPSAGRYEWLVSLWTGAGYSLDIFGVYANDEEQALEKVVAYCERKGHKGFFIDDATEEDEDMGYALYVDATMEGAKRPHYVRLENLDVERL